MKGLEAPRLAGGSAEGETKALYSRTRDNQGACCLWDLGEEGSGADYKWGNGALPKGPAAFFVSEYGYRAFPLRQRFQQEGKNL